MRVALCLSGHLRSFRDCFPSLKEHILTPLQPDIFISTYYKVGSSITNDCYTAALTTDETYVRRDIQLFYQPKKLHIDKRYPINGKKYKKYLIDPRDPYSIPNMFYKIWHANQLKINYEYEHNFTYDLVIRTRPDIKFLSTPNLIQLSQATQDRHLYLPSFGHFDGICDVFAAGSSSTMDLYSQVSPKLDELVHRAVFKPETLLQQNIIDHNLKPKFLDESFNFIMIRPNGINIDFKQISPGIPNHLLSLS